MKSIRERVTEPFYYLKDKNSEKSTLIILASNHRKGKRFVYSTSKKIEPQDWDEKKRRAKNRIDRKDLKDLNEFIDELKLLITQVLRVDQTIEHKDLKNRLDEWQNRGCKKSVMPSFTEYMKIKIREIEDQNVKDFRTILKYRSTINKLVDYEADRVVSLTFESISDKWCKDFISFLRGRAESGISDNTLNKDVGIIKLFMKYAAKDTIIIDGKEVHYHESNKYLDISIKRVKTTKQFLKLHELRQLMNHRPIAKSHQVVLDYWLFMAFTGLRISDALRFDKSCILDIDGKRVIQLQTFKGRNVKDDTTVTIPLLPEAEEILQRNGGELPKPLSQQKHNDYIKLIVAKAGITRVDEKHKQSINGPSKSFTVNVASKLSSHSARYSFINFMVNNFKIPLMDLKKITGHESIKVLEGYEDGDHLDNAFNVGSIIEEKNNEQSEIEAKANEIEELKEKLRRLEQDQNKEKRDNNLKAV